MKERDFEPDEETEGKIWTQYQSQHFIFKIPTCLIGIKDSHFEDDKFNSLSQ